MVDGYSGYQKACDTYHITPFAIGRKNWLFSHSQAGAKASANLYSIISTAKANGLNAYDYLERIFKELPNTA
jgi:hypothetical protein